MQERTIPNDTTTTQSLKSENWTKDLFNSLPTQSSSIQESSDTHNDLEGEYSTWLVYDIGQSL